MKTVYSILLIIFLSFPAMQAQVPVTVNEDSIKVSKSFIPALSVLIPEADYEVVLKDWIKVLQSNTKSKATNQNGEISIFGARTKDIKEEPFNVYSKLLNHDSLVYLVAAFELRKDEFIERESTPEAFTRAAKFMKEFAVGEYTGVAKDQMDAEDKKLKEAEKELSSLENDLVRLQKSIESNKKDIVSEKEEIIVQKNELDLVSSNINEQRSLLSGMEEGAPKKEKSDFIKELEKRKKKAQNSIDSSEKKIRKAETEIENATALIPETELNIDKAREKVAGQEIIYQKFVEKYKKIKAY